MVRTTLPTVTALLTLVIASSAGAGDCFNDEFPSRNDLEPPPPGSADALLQISDEDVDQLLNDLASYERRQASATVREPPED